MDICRWTVLNANESISFRWIIIVMIYMATIILCLSSETFDERFYVVANNDNVNTNDSTTSTKEMVILHINSYCMRKSYVSFVLKSGTWTCDKYVERTIAGEKYKRHNWLDTDWFAANRRFTL